MTIEAKKRAAITAAVFACIKTGEEAAAISKDQFQENEPVAVSPACFSGNFVHPWSGAGRTAHMHMRTMMQMRAFM